MIKKITLNREFHPFAEGETFDLKPITILVGDQGAGKSTLLDLIVKYENPKLATVNSRYRDHFNDRVSKDGFKDDSEVDNNIADLQFIDELRICYVDTEKHNPRMTHGDTTKEYKDAMIETLRDESLHKIIQTMDGYKNMSKDLNYQKEINGYTNRLLENVGKYFDSKRNDGTILGDEIQMDVTTVAMATMQSHGQSIFPLIEKSTNDKTGYTILLDEPETALSIRSQNKIANMILGLSRKNQVIIATHSPILMKISDNVLSLEHRRWMPTQEFIETQK